MSSIFDALKKLEGEKSADRGGGLKGDLFRPPPSRGGGTAVRAVLIGVLVLGIGGGAALLWSRSTPEPPAETEMTAPASGEPASPPAAGASGEEAGMSRVGVPGSDAERARQETREALLTRYRALRERGAGADQTGEPGPAPSPKRVQAPPIVAFPIHEKPKPQLPLTQPLTEQRAPVPPPPEGLEASLSPPAEGPAPVTNAPSVPPAESPAPVTSPGPAPAPSPLPVAKADPTPPPVAKPKPAEAPTREASVRETPAAAPRRVARAPQAETPEPPSREAAPAEAPAAPLVVKSETPTVTVTEVTYHSAPDRRSAHLRVGSAKPQLAREGDTIEGIEVREILPGAVIVVVAGSEVALDVGESVSLTVTRPDNH
jgi:hypothetical protein